MRTERRALAFLAAVVLALTAAQAEAQFGGGMRGARGGQGQFQPGQRHRGEPHQAMQEDPASRAEFLLGMLHEDLKLSPGQEPAWQSYADKVSALAADISRERGRLKETLQMKALPRIDRAVDVARDRLTALEEIASAAKALYARLTPEQQGLADARLATTLPTNYVESLSAGPERRMGPGSGPAQAPASTQ